MKTKKIFSFNRKKSTSSKQNHKSWFENIYESYFDRLFRFALVIVKDRQLAEDVVAEVFIDLWKMDVTSHLIKDLESYLFVSIKNRAIRQLTRNPFRFEQFDLERTLRQIDKLTPEMIAIEQEMLEIIEQTVKELPDQCRLVYDMVKTNQLSYKETAQELGISESTVRNQTLKATTKIREAIDAYLNEEPKQIRMFP